MDGLGIACVTITAFTFALWQPSIKLPEAAGNAGGISTAIVFAVLAGWYGYRRWREAADEHRQRRILKGQISESTLRVVAEQALRLGRRPTRRFHNRGPDSCHRNIKAATGALASLGDIILKGPAGQDGKSAADLELLLEYLTSNSNQSTR